MRGNELLNKMSLVNHDYVAAADSGMPPKKRIRFFPLAACFALLLTLCGFAYAAYIYWGVGTAESIDFNDLTQPFGTIATDKDSAQEQEDVISVQSDIFKNYDGIVADNALSVATNNNQIPSIYFSPSYMVIFTQDNTEQGWLLKIGESLAIDFSLYEEQSLELEVGYVVNGEYHELSSVMGSSFNESLIAEEDGEYYFCVTNRSSANAVIQHGNIS